MTSPFLDHQRKTYTIYRKTYTCTVLSAVHQHAIFQSGLEDGPHLRVPMHTNEACPQDQARRCLEPHCTDFGWLPKMQKVSGKAGPNTTIHKDREGNLLL